MSSNSPFLTYKVECPVCGTINEFEQVKVGAYQEIGRDTDFRPTGITWRIPKYQAYDPLLYFTATCSQCFYTREFNSNFREWKSDNAFRTYRLKAAKLEHGEGNLGRSVVGHLGPAIDSQRYPVETAVIKLLLAAYDESLAEHHSTLDLGRFYLRIAWVFRGMDQQENPNQAMLNSLIRELDSKMHKFGDAITNANTLLEQFVASLRSHFEAEQIPAEIRSQMYAYRDQYNENVSNLQGIMQSADESFGSLGELFNSYRTELLGSEMADGQTSFHSYPSFTQFLLKGKERWPGIVCNEREALELAIQHYKTAFATGRDIAPGTPQIQASYLIAELSRRIGDYDEARQYFNSTIKTGQEFIYQNRNDKSRTQLARKILELAIEQGRTNLAAAKPK